MDSSQVNFNQHLGMTFLHDAMRHLSTKSTDAMRELIRENEARKQEVAVAEAYLRSEWLHTFWKTVREKAGQHLNMN